MKKYLRIVALTLGLISTAYTAEPCTWTTVFINGNSIQCYTCTNGTTNCSFRVKC